MTRSDPHLDRPGGIHAFGNFPNFALAKDGKFVAAVRRKRDADCPASQFYEFWRALKTLGVPTKMMVYAGEGHMFLDPKHQVDRLKQTVAGSITILGKVEGAVPNASAGPVSSVWDKPMHLFCDFCGAEPLNSRQWT